jgi:hypothetical protein
MRTAKEWKRGNGEPAGEQRPRAAPATRCFISSAALLVKVTATTPWGGTPRAWIRPRDAVGDDARLAAARAGQNQQGPLAVLHGLPLLLIESLEEIHRLPGPEAAAPLPPKRGHPPILAWEKTPPGVRHAAAGRFDYTG